MKLRWGCGKLMMASFCESRMRQSFGGEIFGDTPVACQGWTYLYWTSFLKKTLLLKFDQGYV
jgi:hypothetical protein